MAEDAPKCVASLADGRPCKYRPLSGKDVCGIHLRSRRHVIRKTTESVANKARVFGKVISAAASCYGAYAAVAPHWTEIVRTLSNYFHFLHGTDRLSEEKIGTARILDDLLTRMRSTESESRLLDVCKNFDEFIAPDARLAASGAERLPMKSMDWDQRRVRGPSFHTELSSLAGARIRFLDAMHELEQLVRDEQGGTDG